MEDDEYPTSDAPVSAAKPMSAWGFPMPWEVPGMIVSRVLDTVDRSVAQGATTVREVAPAVLNEVGELQDEGVGLTERVLTAIAGLTFGVPTTLVLGGVAGLVVDQVAFKGAGRKTLVTALTGL